MAPRPSRVPLAWRVPNAPATFVGRKAELRAIRDAASRGPVVVLTGEGGLGKTALACAAVRELSPKGASRAVMVSARPSTPFEQTLVEVIRALGHAGPRGGADLVMLAIDLAEERRTVVVLDDVHHALAEATALLTAAARYGRRARWLATSRTEPRAPELVGQVIRLAPLAEPQLSALARLVNPALTRKDASRVARGARGSPWRLKQLASGTGEDDASRSLLEALATVERPVSVRALEGTLGTSPTSARRTLGRLVRRGLVETMAGGYRIHESARRLVQEGARAPLPMADALASGTPEEALEALRLALVARADARAVDVCVSSFDAMLRAGHARALWTLLAAQRGEAFASYKLRAAMQLAEVKVTTVLDAPSPTALRDRLLWVRALVIEAKAAEAAEAAEELVRAATASGDETIACWATLQHAMAERFHGGPDRGLRLLEAARPVDGATGVIHAALLAFWLAEAGRLDDATRVLERTAAEAKQPPPDAALAEEILGGPLDLFVRYYRMAAFMECGELDRAHTELTAGRGALDVDDTLRASYVQLDGITNLSIARGQLDDAAAILARLLRAAPEGGTTYHTIARLLDIERRLAAGAFAVIERDLDQLIADTRRTNALVHAWCLDTRERLDLVMGVREVQPEATDAPLGSVARSVHALRRAFHHARWGDAGQEPPLAIDVEGTIVRELVLATRGLLAGGEESVAHAERAVTVAARHGWGVRECEARLVAAEARLARGDVPGALEAARTVETRASAMTSARFATEARLLVALADEPGFDVAALEAIAEASDVAPSAARRARAALGDTSVRLDAIDARLLGELRSRAPEIIRLHARPRPGRGWGLDLRKRFAWFPDGRRVSLAKHALLASVIEVIARQGGVATFEELARKVWQRPSFHPLHDTNRIRVTLHRLRALIEDDPQRPKRVVLDKSSYELGPEAFTLVSAMA